MSDRAGAELFGNVFAYLATQPRSTELLNFGDAMWDLVEQFEISPSEMNVDEQLIELGYARVLESTGHLQGGPTIIYSGEDGFFADASA